MTIYLERVAEIYEKKNLPKEASKVRDLIKELTLDGMPETFYKRSLSLEETLENIVLRENPVVELLEKARLNDSPYLQTADIKNLTFSRFNSQRTVHYLNYAVEDIEMRGESSLYHLGLSTRTLYSLMRSEISEIGQLEKLNKDQLFSIRGMGLHGIKEIMESMKKYRKRLVKISANSV